MDSRVTSDFVVAAPKLCRCRCNQEHSPAVIDMLKSAHKIMPDWSQLPIDLLECISRRLTLVVDHLKFSWVCSSWRSTALEFRPYLPPQLPGLMIPNGSDLDSQTRCFSNLSKNKLYKHTLPIPHTEVVVGSAGGSLVTIDRHFNMHIVNPFSNFRVPLPPVSAFPRFPLPPPVLDFPWRFCNDTMDINEKYVMLAALSSSDPQNTIVMVAAGEYGRLAFARPGDDSWTPIVDGHFPYDDAIFYKGAFYAVSSTYGTFVCDIEDPHPKTKLIASAPNALDIVSKKYLVESAGELLLVHRDLEDETQDGDDDNYHYYTANFDVYKLDMSMNKWNQVTSLDDRALFLGFNTSFSVSSLNYEDCCRDCIYFTDDYQDGYRLGLRGGHDMGIFYLKDRNIKRLHNEDTQLIQPAPIWVTPLPWMLLLRFLLIKSFRKTN